MPFSADAVAASRTIGARLQSSPYMVVLAAFSRGVHLVRQSPVVGIGIAVDGRSSDQRGLVGHFTDMRTVRSTDRIAADFNEHVVAIKNETLRALETPQAGIADEVTKPVWGALGGVDAVFNWERVAVPVAAGLEFLSVAGRETSSVRFDLGADVQHVGDRHEISWDFNPEKFDAHTILWLHGFLEETLRQGVAVEVPQVVELMESAMLHLPNQPAWVGDGGELTIAQVAGRAVQISCELLAGGTEIGASVGIRARTFADTVVSVLGVLAAGGVALIDAAQDVSVGSDPSCSVRCDVLSPAPVVDCAAWSQGGGGIECEAQRVSEAEVVRTVNALKAASGSFQAFPLSICLTDRPGSLPVVAAIAGALGAPAVRSIEKKVAKLLEVRL